MHNIRSGNNRERNINRISPWGAWLNVVGNGQVIVENGWIAQLQRKRTKNTVRRGKGVDAWSIYLSLDVDV